MNLPQHDLDILAAVRAGRYDPISWRRIVLGADVEIDVMADALRVDGVCLSTTPIAAQLIADELGGTLLTPLLADLIWERADVRLHPKTQRLRTHAAPCPDCGCSHPGPWARCQPCGELERSRAEDEELAAAGDILVAGRGKPWVLRRCMWAHPELIGQPYGWHVSPGECVGEQGCYSWRGVPVVPGVTKGAWVIQGLGAAVPHNGAQLDYAEPVRLWRGASAPDAELLRGSETARYVSHEGPLPDSRLPGVERGCL